MNEEDHERQMRRHKHHVKSLTTLFVVGALVMSFVPHDYTQATFLANVLANLFWIWKE